MRCWSCKTEPSTRNKLLRLVTLFQTINSARPKFLFQTIHSARPKMKSEILKTRFLDQVGELCDPALRSS